MPTTAAGQANAGQSLKVIVTRVYAGNGVQEAVDGALKTAFLRTDAKHILHQQNPLLGML